MIKYFDQKIERWFEPARQAWEADALPDWTGDRHALDSGLVCALSPWLFSSHFCTVIKVRLWKWLAWQAFMKIAWTSHFNTKLLWSQVATFSHFDKWGTTPRLQQKQFTPYNKQNHAKHKKTAKATPHNTKSKKNN